MKIFKSFLGFCTFIEYVAFICATVSVLCFQFFPEVVCIYIALSCYVVGTFLIALRAIINCVEVFAASRIVHTDIQALITSGRVNVINSKTEKVKQVILSIISILFCLFSIAVLILYPIALHS